MALRKPPRPPHFLRAKPGQCRWCGGPIYDRPGVPSKRKLWHKKCLAEYLIATSPNAAREAVVRRDAKNGILPCAKCLKPMEPRMRGLWEVDHIRPLWRACGRLEFWALFNLQALCIPCHKSKSAEEARQRAAFRRGNPT
jgi:5-methylcytosine-specific restriction endonuclease McrA